MQPITIAPPKRSWFSLLSWAVVLAVLVVSWQGAEMAPLTLIKDGGNMATFAADFFPPDFSQWQDYLTEMAVTLQIAVWGTALAVVLSIPFGLMSAENLVPWWVYQPVRRLMDACRAINEMVFAMLFVVAVGLGPFAGVLALFIHTTGVLSKLLSEAVEAIESGPVEGIRATGANKLEEILYGVLPQVMPLLISYSLYRFESNVRSATVVGMVGAGGIGVTLWEAIRGFQFQQTCALMVLIIVTVSLLDLSTHPTSYPTRYQEIAAKLEQELRQHYRCGDYLPAEQQLAARFEVNRHTLRRAIDQLVEKGWVQRRQGVGVLVLMRPFDYPLNAQARFSQNLLDQGSHPTSEKLLSVLRPASGHVADALGITEGENVIHLRTLRRVNGVALCLIDHYFADLALWPTLQRFDSGSLHDFLRRCCACAPLTPVTVKAARRSTPSA